jgi:acetolactate synthase I/II/III large subunit
MTAETPMTLADALVLTLRSWGIGYVFGVSGANIEHLHDAIHRLGEGKLVAVLSRSEIGAACMADAHARVHRTLGVCCATSGGGMMNLSVGVAEAYAESVPMLAIVGQPPSHLAGAGAFQDSSGIGRTVDALALWGSITKRTERIDDVTHFWTQLVAAVRTAFEGRRGPAALLIPRDCFALPVPPRPAWVPQSLAELRGPVLPEPAQVEALFERLQAAHRPVFVLGTGLSRCDDASAVIRFAERTGAAVVTTMGNPGAYDPGSPGYLGMIGVAGHPSAHAYINQAADCIVAVGTGLDVMVRAPIAVGLERVPPLVVNLDLGPIQRAMPTSVCVKGDAGAVFAALEAMLQTRPLRFSASTPPVSRYVPVLAEQAPVQADTLLQSVAIARLQQALPSRGHLLFDAGNCAASSLHYLSMPPQVSTTIALGMGGMGYAIGGAIGAQLGSPSCERTMVLCGDGAFLMQGFEVHTAVEWDLPILFVVFNNNQHGMCVTRQQLFFDGRLSATRYPHLAVATVGEGLGAGRLWVGSAETPAELDQALAAYFEGPARPGLLELRLHREELPPFSPFLGKHAATTTRCAS